MLGEEDVRAGGEEKVERRTSSMVEEEVHDD